MNQKPWLRFYGDKPETLNYPDGTMYRVVVEAASKYPNHTAYSFLGRRKSYSQFILDIECAAKGLTALGVQKGDICTICMPNVPSAVTAFYALNKIGAIASMIHPLSTSKEIEYYLNQSRSTWAMTLNAFYPNFEAILKHTGVRKVIIATLPDDLPSLKGFLFRLTNGRKIPAIKKSSQIFPWKRILQNCDTAIPIPYDTKQNGDSLAAILYSGGTTGHPKGIMLTSKNFNAFGMQTATMGGMNDGDKMLSILPMFHGFGLGIGIHAILMQGGTCVLIPKFEAATLAALIDSEKPQFMAGVPTLFEALLREKKAQKASFSSFKLIASGGDTLPLATKRRFDDFIKARGAKIELLEGYGLTESVTANCLMPANFFREGTVGIPFPDMKIKICKLNSTEVAAIGEEGEICVHGPTVMLGYLNDPEETDKVLRRHSDGEIWLHTGDLGKMDSDGYLTFILRMKRMLKVSGMGVYPPQIEEVLTSHPQVALACAIGVPDEYKMHTVKAFVVPKEPSLNQMGLIQELKDLCSRELNRWSIPSEIEIRESLPLTKIGKVAFTELEKEELAKREI